MKRHGQLWEHLTSFSNLADAFCNARRGKRRSRAVLHFDFRFEQEIIDMQRELSHGRYVPGPYRTFTLHDGKPRLISAAPFRDRVIHHAFCNIVDPIFERSFIYDSYASRSGKGTHAAIRRYQHFARTRRFVLKCDIRRFFPSVDHQILEAALGRKIKDRRVMQLAATIIAHSNPQIDVPGLFPGDTLLTCLERRRGLPIGNQTSQFFGNVFLDPLDHFIKEKLRCSAYLRYVDDFVVLANSIAELAVVRDQIEAFLVGHRLWLHPQKRVISRVDDGIRLLGYRVWANKVLLTGDGIRKFLKRVKRYQRWFATGRLTAAELTQRMRAWIGHAIHGDSGGLRRDLFRRIVFHGPRAERSCVAWGFLEQQSAELPLCEPQQEHTR